MADMEKILRLVSEGALTPAEADEILSASAEPVSTDPAPTHPPAPPSTDKSALPSAAAGGGRHLRIEVTENGQRIVNLRVPMNIAGWASAFLPGISDDHANRIRGAMASGERGALLDINSDDGSRVLIVSE